MTTELVTETADAVLPLLSAGVGAAAHKMAEDAGSDVFTSVKKVFGRLRSDLGEGEEKGHREVEEALRRGLAEGAFDEDDLHAVVAVSARVAAVGGQIGSITVHGNAYSHNTFKVEGDFKG